MGGWEDGGLKSGHKATPASVRAGVSIADPVPHRIAEIHETAFKMIGAYQDRLKFAGSSDSSEAKK